MSRFKKLSHTLWHFQYHIVWTPKYRLILRGVISKDHVHILVSAPPNISPSDKMRRVKVRMSRKILEESPHIKKRYWGRHFWVRGYFYVISCELGKEMI